MRLTAPPSPSGSFRLGQQAQPGAVLLLAPDETRLRQARRLLDAAPFVGFLALEEDAALAGANSPLWRTPSGGVIPSAW